MDQTQKDLMEKIGDDPTRQTERKGSRIRKQGERSNARDEENRKNWERKAREEASRSSVALMDVVEISQAAEARVRGSGSSGKARGMVVKTQGVPGLNKVCVRLEDTGKEVILDRGKIAKVSDEDLSRRPYAPRRAEGNKNPDGRRDGKEGARGGSDSNSDGDERRDRSARRGGTRKRGRSRSRSASRSRYDEVGRPKSGVEGDGGGGEGHAGSDPDEDHDRSRRKRSKSRKDKDKDRGRSKKSGGRRESKKDKDKDDDNARGQASHADRRSARDDRGREDGTEDTSSPDRRRRRDEKYRRKSDRDRDHGRDRGGSDDGENGAGSSDDQRGEGGRGDDARFREAVWLRPNIRVRVIHRSYASGRAYLGKGKVVDVPRPGQATLRMDSGDVLEGVSQQHLETVLPGRGGKVIVVRGPEKGVTGKLLGKNKGDETALIQVFEDLRAITLSLDDVAEFTAMLDEDVEDLGY